MLTKTFAREAPATGPIPQAADPAHPAVPIEPVLNVHEIQGNIVPGFNKDHQILIFLRIVDLERCKKSLASLVPFISTCEDVLTFNRLFKSMRSRQGDSFMPQAVWINIAFTFPALQRIMPADANNIIDNSFKQGMSRVARALGDPVDDDSAAGNPKNWLVGGLSHPIDIILILAGDDPNDLLSAQSKVESSLLSPTGAGSDSGLQIVFRQAGDILPPPKKGHEHFGFLDGVSQPGVRGRASSDPTDVLTPRQNPNDPDQGKPGQDLLWPGEFIFGYPGQDASKDIAQPADRSSSGGPAWMNDGSLLVFRRLRQDVGEFHRFLKEVSVKLGVTPEMFGAKLVGRWSSGAPLLRAMGADDPALGNNDCANNNFEYFTPSPSPPDDNLQAFQCGDTSLFPASPGDPSGTILPFCGHIRKAYPRNDITPGGSGPTPQEQSETSEQDTQTRRMLRRGIPFGPPAASSPSNPQPDEMDRGLLFLAYQTSFDEQFDFVTRNWVNNPDFAQNGAGFDLIIGQNSNPAAHRVRSAVIGGKSIDTAGFREWVIPTGGEYFFAPSISALKLFLGLTGGAPPAGGS